MAECSYRNEVFTTVRPEVPAHLAGVAVDDLHRWKADLTAIIISIDAQMVARKTDASDTGCWAEYDTWRRRAGYAKAGVVLDLGRVKLELHRRAQTDKDPRKRLAARLSRFARAVADWAEAPAEVRAAARDLIAEEG